MSKEDALETINERIEEIENDQRYQQDDADVQINAPLALIQTALEAEKKGLRRAKNALEE